MRFKNFRPVGTDGEPYSRAGLGLACVLFDLTVVGNARAAEVEFKELRAAQQTSPHYGVSHLGAGQPQHLQTQTTLREFYFVLSVESDPESAFNLLVHITVTGVY